MTTITRINLQLVSPTKYNWSDVAGKITRWKFTPYEKAKAIYVWLCENISYDTSYTIRTADEAWNLHCGVCQAYCEIFYRLGTAVGLDVRIVSGYGRHSDDKYPKDKHGWIVVNKSHNIDEQYRFPESITYLKGEEHKANFPVTRGLTKDTAILIDPTWGAGSVENGCFLKNDHDMSWFDVSPFWMIFTHLPDNPQDQLLNGYYITEAQFRNLPAMKSDIEGYGFEAEDVLSYFLQKGKNDFPAIFSGFENDVEFIDIPLARTIPRNRTVRIAVRKKSNCHIALIHNNNFYIDDDQDSGWRYTNGGIIIIDFTPQKSGRLCLSIRSKIIENRYTTIIEYKI